MDTAGKIYVIAHISRKTKCTHEDWEFEIEQLYKQLKREKAI